MFLTSHTGAPTRLFHQRLSWFQRPTATLKSRQSRLATLTSFIRSTTRESKKQLHKTTSLHQFNLVETTKRSTSTRSADHSQTTISVKHSQSQLTAMHCSHRSTLQLLQPEHCCSVVQSPLVITAQAMNSQVAMTLKALQRSWKMQAGKKMMLVTGRKTA